MNTIPEKAADAITRPAPLTLAQLAIYERIDAPILYADITSLRDNLIAVWIYKAPLKEVARNIERREECALEFAENLSGEEYGAALTELLQACTAFYEMLPRAESGENVEEGDDNGEAEEVSAEGQGKKTLAASVTAQSPSLPNGCAECTGTRWSMFWNRLKRFVLRSFIGATRKA